MRVLSNLRQISRFAEGLFSYFRSSANTFQTQLQPIPIPFNVYILAAGHVISRNRLCQVFPNQLPLFSIVLPSKNSQWPRAGLPLNSVVRILDLQKRPELNGQLGTVVGWDTVEDRCQAIWATLRDMGV